MYTINIENISAAIESEWKVACGYEADGNRVMANYCWEKLGVMLDSMRTIVNWCRDDTLAAEPVEAMDDIRLLLGIVRNRRL